MNVEVNVTKGFKRQAKPLLKKYPSLKEELLELYLILQENPQLGVEIAPDIHKIRLAVKSKGRGKSGGLRIITFVETVLVATVIDDDEDIATAVNLLAIYDKADTGALSSQEIEAMISALGEEETEE